MGCYDFDFEIISQVFSLRCFEPDIMICKMSISPAVLCPFWLNSSVGK